MSEKQGRLRTIRKFIVTILGVTVIFFGLVLMVLPGPGLVVAAFGVAILGLEYGWAKRLASRMRGAIEKALRRDNKQP